MPEQAIAITSLAWCNLGQTSEYQLNLSGENLSYGARWELQQRLLCESLLMPSFPAPNDAFRLQKQIIFSPYLPVRFKNPPLFRSKIIYFGLGIEIMSRLMAKPKAYYTMIF